jgi:putative transposase
MYHRLYYHVIWTTIDRTPRIDARVANFLCTFLRTVAREERVHVLELGIVRTHVHVLLQAPPDVNWSRLLRRLKGGSAAVANRDRIAPEGSLLRWAKGYSLHTVSRRALPAARDYLRNQPSHHPLDAILDWSGDRIAEAERR